MDFEALAAERRSIRHDEYASWMADWEKAGGCGIVSEVMEVERGWERWGGCYLKPGPDRVLHIAHYWNRLPDGRLIDVTADQFGEPGHGVRVVEWGDARYDAWCECGGLDG